MLTGPRTPIFKHLAKHVRVMHDGAEVPDVLTVETTGWIARCIALPTRACDPSKPMRRQCEECFWYPNDVHLATKFVRGVYFVPRATAPWWVGVVCRFLFPHENGKCARR